MICKVALRQVKVAKTAIPNLTQSTKTLQYNPDRNIMDILSTIFNSRQAVSSTEITPLMPPTKDKLIAAPKQQHRKKSAQSPKRVKASKNLNDAIQAVLSYLEKQGSCKITLDELKNHLAYYEYDLALSKATSAFKHVYSYDNTLVRLLIHAWSCQRQYYRTLIQEQKKGVDSPIKEMEHFLKLEEAAARCQRIRKELCDWRVSLIIM